MEQWYEPIRLLAALGFTGLLVMLRLEADRFGAAEYAEVDRYGGRAPIRRRLAWYLIGLGLVALTWFTVPDPETNLYLTLGERQNALVAGLIYGGIGIAQAAAFAFLRYRHLRLPAVRSYPVALVNSVATAFIDEAAFRGCVLGFLVLIGVDPGNAIILQAILYALATRLGAPGRDRYMLVLSIVIGLASGYVTVRTGGIGAAFLGHAITRFATFVATGHAGQPAPVGREDEEIEKRRRIPEGWSTVGTSRESIDQKH
jgi:membrane protease YdiL (CAAX protease family)